MWSKMRHMYSFEYGAVGDWLMLRNYVFYEENYHWNNNKYNIYDMEKKNVDIYLKALLLKKYLKAKEEEKKKIEGNREKWTM